MVLYKDVFGQIILAYLNGQQSYEILERDDGVVDPSFEAVKAYFCEFKDWNYNEKKALQLVRGKVLDIGAGAGRISLHLQNIGCSVIAIDNSPISIKVCKKRGVKDARVLSVEKINSFKAGTFDSVLMLGNNFGLFRNFEKAKQLLEFIHRITKQNGFLIVESSDPYFLKDQINIAYRKENRKRGRMSGQQRLRLRFREYKSDWFDFLFVSKVEMWAILKGTGWTVKEFIDNNSCSYIAVLEKI
jgi:SAM-dependent methyltransferase